MKEWEKEAHEIFNKYLLTLIAFFGGGIFIVATFILIAQLIYGFCK